MATRIDYIPQANAKFFSWQNDFYNRVNEKLNSFKIDAAKLKDVTAAKSKYETAYLRASNAEAANTSDRLERNRRTTAYKKAIRAFVNENIRYNSNVDEYDRNYLGLNIPDPTPTPAPVPLTFPRLSVNFATPEQHTLRITDSEKAGRGKPQGVKECEIWHKITDTIPADNSELLYAGCSSKTSFILNFGAENVGKRVFYRARWINTRGVHGPWGVYTSAIIG